MNEAQLTIVVPVFNRAAIVERTLDSIAAQTLRPLSLIIVDNNSTDGTADVVERWAVSHRSSCFQVTLLNESIPGATAARNRGLEYVKTPVVQFFDSDDVMTPTLCQEVADAFNSNGDLDIVGWDIEIVGPGKRKSLKHFKLGKNPMRAALVHGVLSTQRYAVRTDLVRLVGGWRQDVKVWNDMELSVRLLLKSPNIGVLDTGSKVTAFYVDNSITGNANRKVVNKEKESSLDSCFESLEAARHFVGMSWVNYTGC